MPHSRQKELNLTEKQATIFKHIDYFSNKVGMHRHTCTHMQINIYKCVFNCCLHVLCFENFNIQYKDN